MQKHIDETKKCDEIKKKFEECIDQADKLTENNPDAGLKARLGCKKSGDESISCLENAGKLLEGEDVLIVSYTAGVETEATYNKLLLNAKEACESHEGKFKILDSKS